MGMGLPDVGDLEMRDGLVDIVKELETNHVDLQFRIRNMMAKPEAKRPTPRFMADLERALLEELKSIAADENVLLAGQGMVNNVQVGSSNKEETSTKSLGEGQHNQTRVPKGQTTKTAT